VKCGYDNLRVTERITLTLALSVVKFLSQREMSALTQRFCVPWKQTLY